MDSDIADGVERARFLIPVGPSLARLILMRLGFQSGYG